MFDCGNTIPRKAGDNSLRDTVSQPRIFDFSTTPMWKTQT